MENNLKYILAFSKFESVASLTLSQIYNHFGSMKNAWMASAYDWTELGVSSRSFNTLEKKKSGVNLDSLELEIRNQGINILTIEDEDYPELLKEIYDPPIVLFYKGNLFDCNLKKTLAVVGSRRCSSAALDGTNKIISEMACSDVVIVSGMANGIDTSAHKAALENGLKTIAIMGSGFNHIYPKQNMKLFEQIINDNGAVLSEYYPDKEPLPFRFPRRNRIISGLAKGTLVSEANLKSGALITARLCLEQNRELMCLPGLLSNPNTQGTHKLLKEGAGLVTCANDIYDYMNWNHALSAGVEGQLDKETLNLPENEAKIYNILELEALPIDRIVSESALTIGDIMVILTTLELKGLIKQLPGEMYTRI